MKSLIIAFAMYSKFPMPRVDWEKKALSWALCWFPLVGLAVGAVLWLWLALAGWLGFGAVFTAALAGAGLACVYYVVTARRQFGGVTGDLAGFFLQLCELGMVLCAAVGQRLEVLL